MGFFSRNISNSNNSRSIPTAEDSLAVKAYRSQNLNTDDPRETSYSQHDNFQNGVLKNGQAATFYRQVTDDELKGIKNGKSNINSFLTDENTVKPCVDENGVANQNALSNKTQTEPYVRVDHQNGHNGWYEDENANYRNGIAAFDVNWDKLNAPENRDLKERLCNPDGRSPGSNDIKMAYGTAEANKQFGEGGGNQYYLDRDTFNEAVNRGIFEYNPNKSYVGDKCQNTSVPMKEAAHGKALAENDSREPLNNSHFHSGSQYGIIVSTKQRWGRQNETGNIYRHRV